MGETIEQVIGQEIRRLREAAGVGQSVLAAAARQYGLPWTRALVAAVELGRKRLTLGELALVPLVLAEADVTGGRVLNLADLIPADQRSVTVGPGLEMPLTIARAMLLGDDDRLLGPSPKLVDVGVDRRAVEAAGDAEQKAALALGVSPESVVKAAHQRWGRSLTAERDRRVVAYTTASEGSSFTIGVTTPEWPRRLQAIRGHVTRALLDELQTPLKAAAKKRRKTR